MQGEIDVRSSKPPVRDDEIEHEVRRLSAQKHKKELDAENKQKKKKNIARQELE